MTAAGARAGAASPAERHDGPANGRAATSVKRVGLVVHPRRELGRALASLADWAADRGAEVVQLPVEGQDRRVAPGGHPADCDFVVALGGDGTVLAALHAAAVAEKPVVGIACGSLGALAAVNADHVEEALDRMLAGRWTARHLPALALTGDLELAAHGLNDIVFTRAGAGQISVSVTVDGELFIRFGGDGVIVATSLGSSAYTIAAGGPLMVPGGGAMVVTPLAAHGGSCPPLVLGETSQLELLIEPGHGGAHVEVDGQRVGELGRLTPRRLRIGLVDEHATLAVLGDQEHMLAGLRRRGIVMDSPRVLARDARAAAAAADVDADAD